MPFKRLPERQWEKVAPVPAQQTRQNLRSQARSKLAIHHEAMLRQEKNSAAETQRLRDWKEQCRRKLPPK
jgi:hypothetical protein